MQIISLGRRGGKTLRMVDELRANSNAVLVVHSFPEKERLLREYFSEHRAEYDKRIIIWNDNIRSTLRGRQADLLVDNLDIILGMILGQPIKGATITDENSQTT